MLAAVQKGDAALLRMSDIFLVMLILAYLNTGTLPTFDWVD